MSQSGDGFSARYEEGRYFETCLKIKEDLESLFSLNDLIVRESIPYWQLVAEIPPFLILP